MARKKHLEDAIAKAKLLLESSDDKPDPQVTTAEVTVLTLAAKLGGLDELLETRANDFDAVSRPRVEKERVRCIAALGDAIKRLNEEEPTLTTHRPTKDACSRLDDYNQSLLAELEGRHGQPIKPSDMYRGLAKANDPAYVRQVLMKYYPFDDDV